MPEPEVDKQIRVEVARRDAKQKVLVKQYFTRQQWFKINNEKP